MYQLALLETSRKFSNLINTISNPGKMRPNLTLINWLQTLREFHHFSAH